MSIQYEEHDPQTLLRMSKPLSLSFDDVITARFHQSLSSIVSVKLPDDVIQPSISSTPRNSCECLQHSVSTATTITTTGTNKSEPLALPQHRSSKQSLCPTVESEAYHSALSESDDLRGTPAISSSDSDAFHTPTAVHNDAFHTPTAVHNDAVHTPTAGNDDAFHTPTAGHDDALHTPTDGHDDALHTPTNLQGSDIPQLMVVQPTLQTTPVEDCDNLTTDDNRRAKMTRPADTTDISTSK
jgi:hypothetical protein